MCVYSVEHFPINDHHKNRARYRIYRELESREKVRGHGTIWLQVTGKEFDIA